MCLARVVRKYKRVTMKEVVAYKIFKLSYDGVLETPWQTHAVARGEWVHAHIYLAYNIEAYDGNRNNGYYSPGFHAFATREEAEWALKYLGDYAGWGRFILTVKLRGVTSWGYDGTDWGAPYVRRKLKTFVANEMYVSEDENA